jgi:hypothetical protein
VVFKVVDLTIRTSIDGVFVDMQVANAIRGDVGIEEGEEMLVAKVAWVEANIIRAQMLENDVEAFGELD